MSANRAALNVHYRCVFDLIRRRGPADDPRDPGVVSVATLTKAVASWVMRRAGECPQLRHVWFLRGGRWAHPAERRLWVETKSLFAEDEPGPEPVYWAARYEHPCQHISRRQWRTDVGLTDLGDGTVRFALATTNYVLPGYIGDEPPSVNHSAPRIVSDLIRSQLYEATRHAERLATRPVVLTGAEAQNFARWITRAERTPLVYVTRRPEDGAFAIDPEVLAVAVAGVAMVYHFDGIEAERAFVDQVPHHLRCIDGAARAYMPGASWDDDYDRRHRYFLPESVAEKGPDSIVDTIALSLARRGYFDAGDAVATIEDVATRRRDRRIRDLLARPVVAPDSADARALGEEVRKLRELHDLAEQVIHDQDAKLAEAALERDAAERRHDQLSQRIEELARECKEHDKDRKRVALRIPELERQLAELAGQARALDDLAELPADLHHVVRILSRIHADRIAFTEEAVASAKDHDVSDPAVAWRCLWTMARDLHDLYFDGQGRSMNAIKAGFESACGREFELAPTEGGETNRDPRLKKLRERLWRGKRYDISTHIKWGVRKPKLLRVYYDVDHDRRLIVVGHCGDHLETAGTGRK